MGPITNEPTASKVDRHLADASSKGATVVHGGGRVDGLPTVLYYQPTVVDGVTPEHAINREETFGPVAPVMASADEEEALRFANESPLGLVGSVFTRDVGRAIRVAEALECGVVNINETSAYWQPHTPFGGFSGKQSGLGRIGGRLHADGDDPAEDDRRRRRRTGSTVRSRRRSERRRSVRTAVAAIGLATPSTRRRRVAAVPTLSSSLGVARSNPGGGVAAPKQR